MLRKVQEVDDAITQRIAFATGNFDSLSKFARLIRVIGYIIELFLHGVPWIAIALYKFMFDDVSKRLFGIPAIEFCGNLLYGTKIMPF